jgi:hypothetical protein
VKSGCERQDAKAAKVREKLKRVDPQITQISQIGRKTKSLPSICGHLCNLWINPLFFVFSAFPLAALASWRLGVLAFIRS